MTSVSNTTHTEQHILNQSADNKYEQQLATVNLVEEGDTLIRQPKIATEETLQKLVEASGGSVYNFIQSATETLYKYYGFASTTGWKIKRKELATGIWMVASGDGDYTTNFGLRSSKTYNLT